MRARSWLFAVALVTALTAFVIYVLPGLPGVPRTEPELKFAVLDKVGDPLVCTGWGLPNPRFSPYTEYPGIVRDLPTYLAILRHTELPPGPLTDDQVVTVYRTWLKVRTVDLEWRGGDYDFKVFLGPSPSSAERSDTVGRVDLFGRVYDVRKGPDMGACPICLPAGTLVATPNGPAAVQRLEVGSRVWSADNEGRRVEAVVERAVTRHDAPGSTLVHLVLSDGRELTASAPHRLRDGRTIGSLQNGDSVDGARVEAFEVVPDQAGNTYDILPSGDTGDYWVDGMLVRSTLRI